MFNESKGGHMADKPIECSKCKRAGCINYKEMKDGNMQSYCMCKSCPLLKSKLHEAEPLKINNPSIFKDEKSNCPVCGQSKEEFTITLTLGCGSCAETFKDILSQEIKSLDLIPQNVQNKDFGSGFHLGNIPKTHAFQGFSKTMETLHLALNEAVQSEHFEDAADIRDQIQKYLENPNAGTK